MESIIIDRLNGLANYYGEQEQTNLLLEINDTLITKKEITELLIEELKTNFSIELVTKVRNFLKKDLSSSTEMSLLRELKTTIKNFNLSNTAKIAECMKSKEVKRINKRYTGMILDYNRFLSFKENQNNYDNMISILKIIRRQKEQYNRSLKTTKVFDSKEDNTLLIIKDFKNDALKEYSIVRFIL